MPAGADPQHLQASLETVVADVGRTDNFLLNRFESYAETTPDAIAVSCDTEICTYRQLNAAANRIACSLMDAGATRGTNIAVLLEPSVAMIAAVTGIMKAGAAYVPLDPAYPRERLQTIIGQAKPLLLVTSSSLDPVGLVDDQNILLVEQLLVADLDDDPGNPAIPLEADDLCYLMFTSGSTGTPNGVMVSHGNIAGLFENVAPELCFDAGDCWSAMHSFAFGFSVWEIWGPLSTGGRLLIVPGRMRGDPAAWSALVIDASVSVLSITPSAFRQWLLTSSLPAIEALACLRMIVFSGEAVRPDDLATWFKRYGDSGPLLVNTYALTETAGRITLKVYVAGNFYEDEYEDKSGQGDIGRPVADADIFILDADTGQQLSAGQTGELVVAGPMVARGYINNRELTAQRFVDLDPGDGIMRRCYRTGDRALWTPDGTLRFAGRVDDQIKLRGYRIELREIEQVLRKHPAVTDAAVVVHDDGVAPQLAAWVIPTGGRAQSVAGAVEFWPSLGEYQVYDDLLYDFMSADEIRVDSYRRAFARQVKDKVVLDIGTGKDAVLARMCAAAGARKVYAVEVLEDACASARKLIADLGLSDRIEVIQGDMQSVILPEIVSVCTQGIVGNIGSSDGIATIWNNARRLFADDCVAIPSLCETMIAPAQLPEATRASPGFSALAATYAEKIFADAGGPFDVRLCVRNFPVTGLLATPALFEKLDFNGELQTAFTGQAEFIVDKPGVLDGFLLWTRIRTDDQDTVDFLEHQQAWLPVWFPITDVPITVTRGDAVLARWRCETPAGQIFPDYFIEVEVQGDAPGAERAVLSYSSKHFEEAYQATELHRRIFSADADNGVSVGLDELHSWAATQLPPQMVPVRWEKIDQLPLNANGKLDRQALSQVAAIYPEKSNTHRGDSDTEYADPLERDIAAIWCDVLGREAITRAEDFFDAGGDSIVAVRLTTEVQRYLDDTVFLAGLFDAPTVAAYTVWLKENHAEAVARRLSAAAPVIAPASGICPSADRVPPILSWPQQSLWFLQQLYPQSAAANEQFLIRVTGDADATQLRQAWHSVLAGHDILRTCFAGAGTQPEPRVVAVDDCIRIDPTPFEDIAHLSMADAGARLAAAALQDIALLFDLSVAPLLRTRIYHMPNSEMVLLVTAHHIIADGLCVPLIRDALAAAYAGKPQPRPELQYADFARWQHQALGADVVREQLEWWRRQLDGHAGQPVVAIKAEVHGGESARTSEVRLPFAISVEVGDKLRNLAEASGVTLFMLLLATWRVWLQRCFSEADLLIGSPVTLRRDEATARMMGCMVNNVIFRNPLHAGQSFAEVLQAERQAALATYDHGELPFEKIVEALQPERHFGRHPLFQLMFMFEDRSAPPVIVDGLSFVTDVLPVDRASYWDMELSVSDCGSGREMPAFIGVREDLFDVQALQWWPEAFVAMLEGIVADPLADTRSLPLLSNSQRQTVLVDWNDTFMPVTFEQTLHGLVAEQMLRTPDEPAVSDAAETLSYAELNARADKYAAVLAQQGIAGGQRVGLCVERSADTIALLLAVLKRGAIWLPLDPGYPELRLKLMLEVAQPDLVVTDGRAVLPEGCRVLRCSDLHESAADIGPVAPVKCNSQNDAWILFTSGSTGRPKGMVSAHAGAISRCQWMWQEYAFSPADVFAQRTSLNFVDAIWEIFGPLMHGARVTVLPAQLEHDPVGIVGWLVAQGVTHLVTVPQLLTALLDAAEGQAETAVHTVICSGEHLSPLLARRLHHQWPGCRLLNTYGTSETWDGSCYLYPDDANEQVETVPIGKPVANASLYILDEHRQPVPPGVTGELYIGGLALAQGYIGNDDLTHARFLPDPFSNDRSARIYRSGDLARYRGNGDVELLSRTDRQIKLRGLRIEAGDIESLALNWPGVKACALVLREKVGRDSWLALFVVADKKMGANLSVDALRTHLRESLPRAMVPADICLLDELPLMPSGKVDLLALPQSTVPAHAGNPYAAPRDQTEQQLVEIWAAALDVERVGIFDDFFALRGHSLLAIRVIARICDVCGVEVPLQSLFETPTVAGLARSIEALRWARDGRSGRDGSGGADDAGREVVRL